MELFPNRVLIELSRIAFQIIVLPKDDSTDFAQERRLDLPYWTMIWEICVLVDVSKCLDILSDGASSILTWVQADTASVLILCQLLLQPSLVMLMIPVQ